MAAGALPAATLAELAALMDSYAAAWRANRAAALQPFWDRTGAAPLYIAEEIDAPILTWAALDAYWAKNETLHRKIDLRFSDVRGVALAADVAAIVAHMAWDIAFASGASAAMGGENRVAATLRRTPEGWRLAAWVEAPLAPITYLRRLYERAATPGFLDA
ncbi:MAG: nuclear transport factor 2 family protein [Hyphomonadaceae bacterium]|nr:nuclear transport factor 2 family protein [Hyphomonadaceae bacterium]